VNEFYNKHYIFADSRDRITDGWSDGPRPDKDTTDAICISEQGGYQFRLFPGGEENPVLYTMDGVPLDAYSRDGLRQRRPGIHPRAVANRARAAAGGCGLLGGPTGGDPVSVFEMAKKYYPRLWGKDRLEALVKAGRLSEEEMERICNESE